MKSIALAPNVTWNADGNLLITGSDARKTSNLLHDLLEKTQADAAYVNVARSVEPPHASRMALVDDLDGANRIAETIADAGKDMLLAIDGLGYWLRGPDYPMDNPDNNPSIAAWNEKARLSSRKRINFRMSMQKLAENPRIRVVATCPPLQSTISLLAKWPCGLSVAGSTVVDVDDRSGLRLYGPGTATLPHPEMILN